MIEQTSSSITVRDVAASSPTRLFDLLADPARHQDIDGSGMVRAAEGSVPVTGLGQAFVMNMHQAGRDYQTENLITVFEAGRSIEWMPGRPGNAPFGARWRWDLEPMADGRTAIVHTYDWSDITDPALLARITLPRVPAADLEQSARRLAELAELPGA